MDIYSERMTDCAKHCTEYEAAGYVGKRRVVELEGVGKESFENIEFRPVDGH